MVIPADKLNDKLAANSLPVDIQFIKKITDEISPEEVQYVADVKSICDDCEDCGCDAEESEDILYVTKIMAFADKFRVLHWTATNHSIHTIIDDFCKDLETYKDSIAENIQAICGQFTANNGMFRHIELPIGDNPLDIINQLKMAVNNYMEKRKGNVAYEGVLNATSGFLELLYKTVYLLRLAK